MNSHEIYVTAEDAVKLRALIAEAQRNAYRNSAYLHMLSGELDRAVLSDPADVPPDIITMNTRARLIDLDTGEEMVYTLVFPEDADPVEGRISVLAPIGTAMLGYRVGDDFEWDTPGGLRKIRVDQILYQPENAKDGPAA